MFGCSLDNGYFPELYFIYFEDYFSSLVDSFFIFLGALFTLSSLAT